MLGKLFGASLGVLGRRQRPSSDDWTVLVMAEAKRHESEHRFVEAAAVYRELLGKRPRHLPALLGLADLSSRLDRHDDALNCYEAASAIAPNDLQVLFKLGGLYWALGRLGDADECWHRILERTGDHPHALNNLGLVRQEQGAPLEAERYFRAALQRDPNYVEAASNLLLSLNYHEAYPPEAVYREHKRWAEAMCRVPPRVIPIERCVGRRLRVGYISPNLHMHSVAYFLAPLLEHHDATRFEIFCYDDATRTDAVNARLRSCAEHWRTIAELGDAEAEQLILEDRLDILVELAGHTADNRLRLLARRVAPLQVSYLGYPNTTGIESMDYRITDAVADPEGSTDSLHTESLARLPVAWCYSPPPDAPSVAERPESDTVLTFGSFNTLAKVSSRAIALWSQVLHAVPNSSLLLKCRALSDVETADNVKRRFYEHGIAAGRLRLLGFARTNREHLASYGEIDIALDTYPYCGTTTTCEALYMGVPVITLAGRVHASRVGASLLSALNHREWIAGSEGEFVRIACKLACDSSSLARLRVGLRAEMAASPVMDALKHTRSVEAAYNRLVLDRCTRGRTSA